MLQAYSSNLDIAANTAYPLNNVTLKKGCSVVLSGPSTIQLNQRGVYLIHYDGYALATTNGEVSTQLYINGVAQPEAISSFDAADTTDTQQVLHFETCVQVSNNNCNCNLTSSPTIIQFINTGVAIENAHINIIVTKLF